MIMDVTPFGEKRNLIPNLHQFTLMCIETKTMISEKDEKGLAKLLVALYHSMSVHAMNFINNSDVSVAQFNLLLYLNEVGPMSMTQESKLMGHSTAAATGFIDRLERLGYVQRLHLHDLDDRRKVIVQITRKGIDLVESYNKSIEIGLKQSETTVDSPFLAQVQNALEALLTYNIDNPLVAA